MVGAGLGVFPEHGFEGGTVKETCGDGVPVEEAFAGAIMPNGA